MNLKIFCRICLEAPNTFQKLNIDDYCDEERKLSYRDCLNILTGIQLPENEDKPENLCCTCGEELKISYNFHKKIEDANQILAEMKTMADDNSTPDESFPSTVTITIEEDDEVCKLQDSLNSMIDHDYLDAFDAEEDSNTEMHVEFIEVEEKCIKLENEAVTTSSFCDGEIEPNEDSADELEANTNAFEVEHLLENAFQVGQDTQPTIEKESSATKKTMKRKQNHKNSHKCEFCDKMFPNNSRLLHHMTCHDPTRPRYHCLECHRFYSTKASLDAHTKIVHEKNGHVCSYCGKMFAIKKGLEIHMRYHTGEFPFNCIQCDKKFAQICHLNTHINVIHNHKRFTCEYPNCTKIFTNSASLRNHEFSHGMKPFKCEFCQKEYPCKAKLKVHIRRKHNREMSLEELERMRQFYNQRSRPKMVQVAPIKT